MDPVKSGEPQYTQTSQNTTWKKALSTNRESHVGMSGSIPPKTPSLEKISTVSQTSLNDRQALKDFETANGIKILKKNYDEGMEKLKAKYRNSSDAQSKYNFKKEFRELRQEYIKNLAPLLIKWTEIKTRNPDLDGLLEKFLKN